MTNRITQLFNQKSGRLLNVYFTAGFPQLNDTRTILKSLEEAGADLVEIGMPYSDPVADGETIQLSNDRALHNGMTVKTLFQQLEGMREEITVPVLLMGYINPVIQFGVEAFCRKCQEVGVDGLILPDLPADIYEEEFKPLFDQYGLVNIFLITPQTSDARIRHIDSISEGFIYMVSSASTTGAKAGITAEQEAYFNRVNGMELKNQRLIGFGISDNASFERASRYAAGAIIGSAFIKAIAGAEDLRQTITGFVKSVKG